MNKHSQFVIVLESATFHMFISVINQLDTQNVFFTISLLHTSTCKTKILCIKLVNYWDKYTEMHGQQIVKIFIRCFIGSNNSVVGPQISNGTIAVMLLLFLFYCVFVLFRLRVFILFMFLFNFLLYLFYYYVYVFLLLCMLCSVYSVFIVPTGTLRLPWLRFFRAFSSVVRQMPGYNLQRRGTAHTLPKIIVLFCVLFVSIVLFYVFFCV